MTKKIVNITLLFLIASYLIGFGIKKTRFHYFGRYYKAMSQATGLYLYQLFPIDGEG